MSLFHTQFGNLAEQRVLLTNVNAEILAKNESNGIWKIRVTNITGGAVTFGLDAYDGTTHKPLATVQPLAAGVSVEITDEFLMNNEALWGVASAVDSVWVHIGYALNTRQSGR